MLVELENVSKTYTSAARPVRAIRDLGLRLDQGEFLAVCGPSGCGKSTLLLTIGGLLRPDAGVVRIAGTDLYRLSTNDRARFRAQTIGFVFQQFHLIPYLSVMDNVLAARLGCDRQPERPVRERAEGLIHQLGLNERVHHKAAQLSTGERQRTALARALLNEPRLLLADEPTGNLDPENAGVVLDQLRAFTQLGGAVLLVTHDPDAARRADRTMRLEQGSWHGL
jgi:ABC-type lipoprotein export system ATPase subunit